MNIWLINLSLPIAEHQQLLSTKDMVTKIDSTFKLMEDENDLVFKKNKIKIQHFIEAKVR